MTRMKSMQTLRTETQELVDCVKLTILLVDDHPILGETALVGFFRDSLVEILGLSTQALNLVNQPRPLALEHLEVKAMQTSLVACQEMVHHIESRLYRELLCYPKMRDLLDFASQESGEWVGWASSVQHSLESCWDKHLDMNRVVIACWRELIE